jgi:tRNA U55 pseudouridine synthase TruB
MVRRKDRTPRRRWTPAQLTLLAAPFVGRIQQVPPAFSAKKIHGRPAHELARKKKAVVLEAAEVDVYEFRLTSVSGSIARFDVECGSGTYIRSLAHDLGQKHGSGAHLAEIVRTAVGEFTLDQALTLEEVAEARRQAAWAIAWCGWKGCSPELPRATVLPIVERRIAHGAKFNVMLSQIQPGRATLAPGAPAELDSGDWKPARLRVFNQQDKLVAIAEAVVPRTYQPVVVLEALQ